MRCSQLWIVADNEHREDASTAPGTRETAEKTCSRGHAARCEVKSRRMGKTGGVVRKQAGPFIGSGIPYHEQREVTATRRKELAGVHSGIHVPAKEIARIAPATSASRTTGIVRVCSAVWESVREWSGHGVRKASPCRT